MGYIHPHPVQITWGGGIMNRVGALLLAYLAFLMLILTSCNTSTQIVYTTPITSIQAPQMAYAYDDVLGGPNGPMYRANFNSSIPTTTMPFINVTTLTVNNQSNSITYRDTIATNNGETRSNIISVKTFADPITRVALYTGEIPEGFSIGETSRWSGLLGRTDIVLMIGVADSVMVGRYTFKIKLEINNSAAFLLPCTVDVTG